MKSILLTKQNILSVAVSLVLFSAVPVVLAWTAPTSVAPSGNTRPPLNISSSYDIKSGKLGLFGDTFLRISRDASYIPTGVPGDNLPSLLLGANGKVGAAEYCDERGDNCKTIQQLKAALGI